MIRIVKVNNVARCTSTAAMLAIIAALANSICGCAAIGGAVFSGLTGTANFSRSNPMPPETWQGVEKVRLCYYSHSSVYTTKTNWEQTALEVMTTTAAGAGGAIVSGSHAGFAAVQGFGYAAGSAATGGAQEEDSLRFSRQIQENIGDWRLDDVFRPKLFQAIRARTTLDVEVVGAAANFERILADMKQSDPEQFEQSEQVRNMKLSSTVWNSDVVSWDMRQAAQRGDPPCKQIEMNLGVILTGESRPEANITLMWFVQEDDDSAEKSGADNEPFKLVDVNQAARSQRKKYITNNRFYVISSAGHSRKDWTANGCALLKREVEKAINELCAKMAKDMFP